MQFSSALAKQLCFFRINTANQFIEKRAGRRRLILEIGFATKHTLVIAANGVES